MSTPQEPETEPPAAGGFDPEDHWGWSAWEWWARAAVLLTATALITWVVVAAHIGLVSVAAHAFVIPVFGLVSLPIALWGLVRTTFNPPLLRRSRLTAFGLLLAVGFTGNVPIWPAPAAPVDAETDASFHLPFEGTWYTLAGGASPDRNYHATTSAWRWGYDFTVRNTAGERHRGSGDSLEDYFCYGRQILAPAAGEAVEVADGHRDAEPGEFDETSVLGNHVVLKVAADEYLFLAQLKKGSVAIQKGDEVDRGEKIGECGNSGRAVLPHLHIHLQDRLQFPMAMGLPLRFSDLQIDGEQTERGMPIGEGEESDGQEVRPAKQN